jgi:cytochrome P450
MLAGGMQPFLRSCHRRYGDCFTIRTIKWGTLVFVSDPLLIKQVLTGDPTVFHFGQHALDLGIDAVIGPKAFLFEEEDAHRRLRRRVSAPFRGQAVRRNGATIVAITEENVRQWPVGSPFPLHPPMRALALEVILRVVIGTTDPVRLRALREVLPAVADVGRLPMMFPVLRPLPPWQRYLRVRSRARELLRAEIADRQRTADLSDRTDVLSMLVRCEDGEDQLDEHELLDLLNFLLIAGHESTATSLSWVFERVLRHPEVLARLYDAVHSDDDAYLDAVVRETLRIRPVTFMTARQLVKPVALAGYQLPAGVSVMTATGLVHMSERAYGDPEVFRPQRFLTDDIDPYAWIPFGGGPRRCLGAALATFEIKTVLRTVLSKVELVPTHARSERVRMRHVTFAPAEGARAVVRRRLDTPEHTIG